MKETPRSGVEGYARHIRQYIFDNFVMSGDVGDIPLDVSLLQEGIVDSYGFVELTEWVEKEFKISIVDEELVPENFGSIHRMARFVALKRGQEGGRSGSASKPADPAESGPSAPPRILHGKEAV